MIELEEDSDGYTYIEVDGKALYFNRCGHFCVNVRARLDVCCHCDSFQHSSRCEICQEGS